MTLFTLASIIALVLFGGALYNEFITLLKVFPEAGVKNGLLRLRRLLLADGLSFFLLALISFLIIGTRFVLSLEQYRFLSYILLILFSIIVFIKSIFKRLIYSVNYTPENKKAHEKIAKKEEKELVIDKKTKKGVR